MKIKMSVLLWVVLFTNFLAFSANAVTPADVKSGTKKLLDHAKSLRSKGQEHLTVADRQAIKEFAQLGAANYKLLDAGAFDMVSIAADGRTPIVRDTFTGEEAAQCATVTCGIPSLNPIPGSPNFVNESKIKDAIELASSQQPITIPQMVEDEHGNKHLSNVQYYVIVKAIHHSTMCFTTYVLGRVKQICY